MSSKRRFVHSYEIQVDEMDMGQVLYHAAYLPIAERMRNQCFREMGVDFNELWSEGLVFALGKLECSYQKAIPLGTIYVRSEIAAVSDSTLTFRQSFHATAEDAQGEGGEMKSDLYRSKTTLVFVSHVEKKARPIPEWIREKLG